MKHSQAVNTIFCLGRDRKQDEQMDVDDRSDFDNIVTMEEKKKEEIREWKARHELSNAHLSIDVRMAPVDATGRDEVDLQLKRKSKRTSTSIATLSLALVTMAIGALIFPLSGGNEEEKVLVLSRQLQHRTKTISASFPVSPTAPVPAAAVPSVAPTFSRGPTLSPTHYNMSSNPSLVPSFSPMSSVSSNPSTLPTTSLVPSKLASAFPSGTSAPTSFLSRSVTGKPSSIAIAKTLVVSIVPVSDASPAPITATTVAPVIAASGNVSPAPSVAVTATPVFAETYGPSSSPIAFTLAPVFPATDEPSKALFGQSSSTPLEPPSTSASSKPSAPSSLAGTQYSSDSMNPTRTLSANPSQNPQNPPVIPSQTPSHNPTFVPTSLPTLSPVTQQQIYPTAAPLTDVVSTGAPSPIPVFETTSNETPSYETPIPVEMPLPTIIQSASPIMSPVDNQIPETPNETPATDIVKPPLQSPIASPAVAPVNSPPFGTANETPSGKLTLAPVALLVPVRSLNPTISPVEKPVQNPLPEAGPSLPPAVSPTLGADDDTPSNDDDGIPPTDDDDDDDDDSVIVLPTEPPIPSPTLYPVALPIESPTASPSESQIVPDTLAPVPLPTPPLSQPIPDGNPPPVPPPTRRPTKAPSPSQLRTRAPVQQPVRSPVEPPVRAPVEPPVRPSVNRPTAPLVPDTPVPRPVAKPVTQVTPAASPSSKPSFKPIIGPSQRPSLLPSGAPSESPSVSFQPTLSTAPSAVPTPSFLYEKMSLLSEGIVVLAKFESRRLQKESVPYRALCVRPVEEFVGNSIRNEVEQVVQTFETLDVFILNITKRTDRETSSIAYTFDVLIEIRSFLTVHDMKRYISGPFDSLEEKDAFVGFLRSTSCPELDQVSSVEIILPTELELADGSTDSNEGVIVGVLVGVAAIALLTGTLIFAMSRNRRKQSQIAEHTSREENSGFYPKTAYEANDYMSEIGLQTVQDMSSLGDPIPPGASASLADMATLEPRSIDYDFREAYLDRPEASIVSHQYETSSKYRAPVSIADADDSTLNAQYATSEKWEVLAPSGLLGLVLETNEDGLPVVNSVRKSSTLFDQVSAGDILVSVDGQDVAFMLASEVSRLIAAKQDHQYRKMVFIRPT